eukprot:278205-Rhodomonas_salina.2
MGMRGREGGREGERAREGMKESARKRGRERGRIRGRNRGKERGRKRGRKRGRIRGSVGPAQEQKCLQCPPLGILACGAHWAPIPESDREPTQKGASKRANTPKFSPQFAQSTCAHCDRLRSAPDHPALEGSEEQRGREAAEDAAEDEEVEVVDVFQRVDDELEHAERDAPQPPPVLVDVQAQERAEHRRRREADRVQCPDRLFVGGVPGEAEQVRGGKVRGG